MPCRILIADDHSKVRRTLKTLLEDHDGWQVCGEAANGLEAVQKAAELKPDLVILYLAMPVMDGMRAAREISSAFPSLPIVMHTNHDSSVMALEAKNNGVRKFVSKGDFGGELIRAIEMSLAWKPVRPEFPIFFPPVVRCRDTG